MGAPEITNTSTTAVKRYFARTIDGPPPSGFDYNAFAARSTLRNLAINLAAFGITYYCIEFFIACCVTLIDSILLAYFPILADEWCIARDVRASKLVRSAQKLFRIVMGGVVLLEGCVWLWGNDSAVAWFIGIAIACAMLFTLIGTLILAAFAMSLVIACWLAEKSGWMPPQEQQELWQSFQSHTPFRTLGHTNRFLDQSFSSHEQDPDATFESIEETSLSQSTLSKDGRSTTLLTRSFGTFRRRSSTTSRADTFGQQTTLTTENSLGVSQSIDTNTEDVQHRIIARQPFRNRSFEEVRMDFYDEQIESSSALGSSYTLGRSSASFASLISARGRTTAWWLRVRELGSSIFSGSTGTLGNAGDNSGVLTSETED